MKTRVFLKYLVNDAWIRHSLPTIVRERTLIMWEGGAREFYKFFKKFFLAQGTKEPNISWPSSFFVKNFKAPTISFSFLFKPCLL